MQHIQRLRAQARAICDLAQKGHRQLTKAERSEVDALIDQITVAKKVEEAAGKLGCGENTPGGDLYSAVTSATPLSRRQAGTGLTKTEVSVPSEINQGRGNDVSLGADGRFLYPVL
jgi:hypothetical protein